MVLLRSFSGLCELDACNLYCCLVIWIFDEGTKVRRTILIRAGFHKLLSTSASLRPLRTIKAPKMYLDWFTRNVQQHTQTKAKVAKDFIKLAIYRGNCCFYSPFSINW